MRKIATCLLLLAFLTSAISAIIMEATHIRLFKEIHEYAGWTLAVLTLCHLYIFRSAVKAMIKSAFKNK